MQAAEPVLHFNDRGMHCFKTNFITYNNCRWFLIHRNACLFNILNSFGRYRHLCQSVFACNLPFCMWPTSRQFDSCRLAVRVVMWPVACWMSNVQCCSCRCFSCHAAVSYSYAAVAASADDAADDTGYGLLLLLPLLLPLLLEDAVGRRSNHCGYALCRYRKCISGWTRLVSDRLLPSERIRPRSILLMWLNAISICIVFRRAMTGRPANWPTGDARRLALF